MDDILLEDFVEQRDFRSGDVPGEGSYRCINCSARWIIQDLDELPECPECNGINFEREDDSNLF